MLLLERYELGDLIARGGMADVFSGIDRRLQRDVAVKVMRPNGAATAADLEARFEDEARVAARLQHPNVVAVYDTGVNADGRPFIVMERMPGRTLGDRMKSGPLPEGFLRAIAEDVLAGLATAHAAGIVHRDIKPGNVLLADDGQAKLADFGIARESDGLVVEPTIANAVTGTPSYLAPERLRGEPASAASDVWAVGVVLYEALAGQKPYAGAAPITDLRPDVGAQLPRVIERAMAVEPAARYATAGEVLSAMRADADATLVDRTLIAEPGVVAAAPVWWRRVPGRAAVIAAGALMLMLALVAIGLAAGDDNRGAAEVTTTTVPVTTTKPTVTTVTTVPTVSVTTPSIVVVNPETPKKNRKGRRGGD